MNTLTIGTFDLWHHGHENLIDECLSLMCPVTVGVNSDEFVKQYKRQLPVETLINRMASVRKYCPDVRATPHNGLTPQFIKEWAPCYLVIGSDWGQGRKDYLKQLGVDWDWMDENGVRLLVVPYTKGISTTL